jgi:1,4-dihydroxy-2-naphthoate octaprenyltransferase
VAGGASAPVRDGLRGRLLSTEGGLSRLAVWLLAVRLRTLPAAAAPVLIGSGLASLHGSFRALPALAALSGALLIQIATNLANDYYDFVRGADTEARVGPLRVTQAGLISPESVRRGMIAALAMALGVGVYLVWLGGWPIVVIGLASLACAVAYTGGPYPLAYHGLGDVFVFVFFGLVAVAGTYWVQALAFAPESLVAGAGVGALSTAILVVNNLRDIDTDAAAGKRTVAVRIGRRGSGAEYLMLLGLAAAAPALGAAWFGWPGPVHAASAVVGLGVVPARRVLGYRDPRELIPALGQTARLVALYGTLLGSALALG